MAETGWTADAPRILEVDLASGSARKLPWPPVGDPVLDLGLLSGPALGLARAYAAPDGEEPFVVCVGDAVRRGLSTAARATVQARSPLTGRLTAGQVGSDLGRRLAAVCDLVCLVGRSAGANVLHIGPQGSVELIGMPELDGLDPARTHTALLARFGACASLRVGPAGEAGVAFANLAARHDPASYVGRGGLGAALGERGLKALVVTADGAPAATAEGEGEAEGEDLTTALLASPRLVARGRGGTLELGAAFEARGDLRGLGYGAPLPGGVGERIERDAGRARRERHGCRGCPTRCGWVFERDSGRRQGAHFSATYALGTNLGLERFDDALALLATCDAIGCDAKEAGSVLAVWALSRAPELPALEEYQGFLEALAAGHEPVAARGAAAFAEHLGVRVPLAAGEAARPETSLASVLGQCVGVRGAEPMRTFPFLVADGVARDRLEAIVAPLPLPRGAEDPRDPAGKGRLVWWHENFVTAVDACGFCAFSAAGLLVDGVCSLDALADWILPRRAVDVLDAGASASGAQLLALGASLLGVQRMLDERSAALPEPAPEWARATIVVDSMEPEYRRLRGLTPDGRLTPEARSRLGSLAVLDHGLAPDDGPVAAPTGAPVQPAAAAQPGSLTLRSSGVLADHLGTTLVLGLDLPATIHAVLAEARDRVPEAERFLMQGSEPVPAVYRGGERLGPADLVSNQDVLDLVLAIAGG
ncbi:MAG: hypothetical protein GY711_19815 [bacterium]|nr:hypothetical protein [bacterium]